MFTLQQINDIHEEFGTPNKLGAYLLALRAIGVTIQESYVSDGHSVYFGSNVEHLESPPMHQVCVVSDVSNIDSVADVLRQAEAGKLDYVSMSQLLAAAGVEKWTFDTQSMTMTYYDKAGVALLSESII